MRIIKTAMVFLFLSLSIYLPLFSQPYPPSPKSPVVDTVFGRIIVDDYRWMEDMVAPETQRWLKSQADYTMSVLNRIPGRDQLISDFQALDKLKPASIGYIIREGGRYFFSKTLPGENVGKLYFREVKTGQDIILFDPNAYTGGKKQITFNYRPSKDGKKVALRINEAGNADISLVKILNVDSKKFYNDSLYPVGGVGSWTPDSRGFIYSGLQTSDNTSTQLFLDMESKYHELGTDQKEDRILASRKHDPALAMRPSTPPMVDITEDGKYLVLGFWGDGAQDENRMFYAAYDDLLKTSIAWKPLVKREDLVRMLTIYRDSVYMLTRKDAPNYKILVRHISETSNAKARVVLPETDMVTEYFTFSKDYMYIKSTDGINSYIKQYDIARGDHKNVILPHSGTAWPGTFDVKSNDCFINLSSWSRPWTIYELEPGTLKTTYSNFNVKADYPGLDDIVIEEVGAKSHDGTIVPLSIYYNKKIKRDGKSIVFMHGYGSYGASINPYFEPMDLPLLNRGVIMAVAHVRGGGEKGFNWQKGGYKATKPNTWKDFNACGEYLVEHKYSSPGLIIGKGTSAGGIMIGMAMLERPELFAAAINDVSVSNPLRGENRPNGLMDAKEFGTARDSVEAMGLIAMDAYLNVKEGVKYPAVLAVCGINDTRVPFWQPGKLAARMQSKNPGNKPVLLLVHYDSGHWTEEKTVQFRNTANELGFALWQAGHEDFKIRD
jgi:prolyl oligopeptidase